MNKIISAITIIFAINIFAQSNSWYEGARMPTTRCEMRAVLINGVAYVAGGAPGPKASVDAYDLANNKWKAVASMPVGQDHHMMAGYQNKVYVMHGKTWVYDPSTDQWTEKTGSDYRFDGTSVALGNKIYVMGGGLLKLQSYSPLEDKWMDLAPLKTLRGHVNAVALGSKIYVLGGKGNDGVLNSVEIYDTTTKVWTDGIPMQDVRSGFPAAVVGGKIVVTGGETYVNGVPKLIKSTEIFDPATGKWSYLADLPTPMHGIACVTMGGKIYLFGGSLQAFGIIETDKVFVLDIMGSTGLFKRKQIGSWKSIDLQAQYRMNGRLDRKRNSDPLFYLTK